MDADAATVLVVDDQPLNVDLLEQELGTAGYRVVGARSGAEALALVPRLHPELILLDIRMPGMDGYETCRRLKDDETTRPIPVIFLTALEDMPGKLQAFAAGAVDYVTKPFEPAELLARVATHIALRREIEAHRRSRATIRALVEDSRSDGLIGESNALARVREQIAQVAGTDATVLIQGETGTGKELVARAIHAHSARHEQPFIRLNCAALPRELVESELFGHEKGAFTGAIAQRRGRFELADGGSLFLDEVGELPAEAQAKLLRVLQEREFERVGGSRSLRVNVRVIAATNRDLRAEVAGSRFRADLFYRLEVFPLALPPLRERPGDIPGLLRHFATLTARRLGRPYEGLAAAFVERACAYPWPGNVRELENLIERALILSPGGPLDAAALLDPAAGAAPRSSEAIEDVEREHIRRTLDSTGGRIEGESGAARRLGMNPSTLRGRMRKLGIYRRS